MADQPFNVLFLCTGNSARSIMAEAILNKLGAGKFRAYSAGAIRKDKCILRRSGSCKAWAMTLPAFIQNRGMKFAKPGAPDVRFCFHCLRQRRGRTCPVWPGQPMTAHWGVPDPAEAKGTAAEVALAFKDAYRMLHQRIGIFTALPLRSLDQLTLQSKLKDIGRT